MDDRLSGKASAGARDAADAIRQQITAALNAENTDAEKMHAAAELILSAALGVAAATGSAISLLIMESVTTGMRASCKAELADMQGNGNG